MSISDAFQPHSGHLSYTAREDEGSATSLLLASNRTGDTMSDLSEANEVVGSYRGAFNVTLTTSLQPSRGGSSGIAALLWAHRHSQSPEKRKRGDYAREDSETSEMSVTSDESETKVHPIGDSQARGVNVLEKTTHSQTQGGSREGTTSTQTCSPPHDTAQRPNDVGQNAPLSSLDPSHLSPFSSSAGSSLLGLESPLHPLNAAFRRLCVPIPVAPSSSSTPLQPVSSPSLALLSSLVSSICSVALLRRQKLDQIPRSPCSPSPSPTQLLEVNVYEDAILSCLRALRVCLTDGHTGRKIYGRTDTNISGTGGNALKDNNGDGDDDALLLESVFRRMKPILMSDFEVMIALVVMGAKWSRSEVRYAFQNKTNLYHRWAIMRDPRLYYLLDVALCILLSDAPACADGVIVPLGILVRAPQSHSAQLEKLQRVSDIHNSHGVATTDSIQDDLTPRRNQSLGGPDGSRQASGDRQPLPTSSPYSRQIPPAPQRHQGHQQSHPSQAPQPNNIPPYLLNSQRLMGKAIIGHEMMGVMSSVNSAVSDFFQSTGLTTSLMNDTNTSAASDTSRIGAHGESNWNISLKERVSNSLSGVSTSFTPVMGVTITDTGSNMVPSPSYLSIPSSASNKVPVAPLSVRVAVNPTSIPDSPQVVTVPIHSSLQHQLLPLLTDSLTEPTPQSEPAISPLNNTATSVQTTLLTPIEVKVRYRRRRVRTFTPQPSAAAAGRRLERGAAQTAKRGSGLHYDQTGDIGAAHRRPCPSITFDGPGVSRREFDVASLESELSGKRCELYPSGQNVIEAVVVMGVNAIDERSCHPSGTDSSAHTRSDATDAVVAAYRTGADTIADAGRHARHDQGVCSWASYAPTVPVNKARYRNRLEDHKSCNLFALPVTCQVVSEVNSVVKPQNAECPAASSFSTSLLPGHPTVSSISTIHALPVDLTMGVTPRSGSPPPHSRLPRCSLNTHPPPTSHNNRRSRATSLQLTSPASLDADKASCPRREAHCWLPVGMSTPNPTETFFQLTSPPDDKHTLGCSLFTTAYDTTGQQSLPCTSSSPQSHITSIEASTRSFSENRQNDDDASAGTAADLNCTPEPTKILNHTEEPHNRESTECSPTTDTGSTRGESAAATVDKGSRSIGSLWGDWVSGVTSTFKYSSESPRKRGDGQHDIEERRRKARNSMAAFMGLSDDDLSEENQDVSVVGEMNTGSHKECVETPRDEVEAQNNQTTGKGNIKAAGTISSLAAIQTLPRPVDKHKLEISMSDACPVVKVQASGGDSASAITSTRSPDVCCDSAGRIVGRFKANTVANINAIGAIQNCQTDKDERQPIDHGIPTEQVQQPPLDSVYDIHGMLLPESENTNGPRQVEGKKRIISRRSTCDRGTPLECEWGAGREGTGTGRPHPSCSVLLPECEACSLPEWTSSTFSSSSRPPVDCGYEVVREYVAGIRAGTGDKARQASLKLILDNPRNYITREAQMAKDGNRCPGCDTEFDFNGPSLSFPARRCEYFRQYFCVGCHVKDERVIPARIVYLWDFETYPVCSVAAQYLDLVIHLPLVKFGVNVDVMSGDAVQGLPSEDPEQSFTSRCWSVQRTQQQIDKVVQAVPNLAETHSLRQLIIGLKATAVMAKCVEAIIGMSNDLMRLEPHMRNDASLYSIKNLIEIYETRRSFALESESSIQLSKTIKFSFADLSRPNISTKVETRTPNTNSPFIGPQPHQAYIHSRRWSDRGNVSASLSGSGGYLLPPSSSTSEIDYIVSLDPDELRTATDAGNFNTHSRESESQMTQPGSRHSLTTLMGSFVGGRVTVERGRSRKTLAEELNTILATWLRHMEKCYVCMRCGRQCTICQQGEALYPHDYQSYQRCVDCGAVAHWRCAELLSYCQICRLKGKVSPNVENG
eukprot:GHVN01096616.1.p1 GENE.GHVN01096616.1~~GHVN01096616.1.p1  ORF type:complete len:1889 (-),score=324.62 GHVN01096616.1:938-6604(-)